jgi:hypothetical protein
VRAQTLKGIILSADSLKPLSSVVVYDLYTSQSTLTDEQGYFALAVNANDMLSFSLPGYRTFQETAPASMEIKVHLAPMDIMLKEYVVHNYTPFQRDSAEMATLYDKELHTKRIKPTMGTPDGSNGAGVGIAMDGLISGLAQKASKSYKQNKRFKENFKRDMEQKFIDTRYTPELVTKLTGYTGDTMILFMNTYPMDYSFARAASDLELKMWIRNNYKEHMQHQMVDAGEEKK